MEIEDEAKSRQALTPCDPTGNESLMDTPFVKFFLWLNERFPRIEHPFNRPRRDGSHRLNYSDFEFEFAQKIFDKYQSFFPFYEWIRGKHIADFACGGGGKSTYLVTRGVSKVTGLDLNSMFIEQAKIFAQEKGLSDSCEFLKKDVQQTSLSAETFDAVIFNDAIDHIADPEKALREALRLVKPGGLIFVNFESYLFPYGHHLLDGIRIPWIHLFTTEKFRMKFYEKTIAHYPDASERLQFRQHYLNKLTLRKFEKILQPHLDSRQFSIVASHKFLPRRQVFRFLSRVPGLSEFFLSTGLWVLQKHESRR